MREQIMYILKEKKLYSKIQMDAAKWQSNSEIWICLRYTENKINNQMKD